MRITCPGNTTLARLSGRVGQGCKRYKYSSNHRQILSRCYPAAKLLLDTLRSVSKRILSLIRCFAYYLLPFLTNSDNFGDLNSIKNFFILLSASCTYSPSMSYNGDLYLLLQWRSHKCRAELTCKEAQQGKALDVQLYVQVLPETSIRFW